jgi:hypothetical protein
MKKITIAYNGNPNLPSDRNHKTKYNLQQLERTFQEPNKAIEFWLECGFYGGAITPLDQIIPKGYYSPILELLEEKSLEPEEVLLPNQKLLYFLTNEEEIS